MKIALASPLFLTDMQGILKEIERHVRKASKEQAAIICFPEACIPGMRGVGVEIGTYSQEELQFALEHVRKLARQYNINMIMPMEWYVDGQRLNVAFFIERDGKIAGYQTKNQLDPAEDELYIAGTERNIFEVDGVKIGIVICHEGFRYPETVRFAAVRGAKIVFHPCCAGSDTEGNVLKEWCDRENPYYEKAILVRAMENDIFFASSNYGFKYQDSATCIVSPEGECISRNEYGRSDTIICDVPVEMAESKYAKRCKLELYSVNKGDS